MDMQEIKQIAARIYDQQPAPPTCYMYEAADGEMFYNLETAEIYNLYIAATDLGNDPERTRAIFVEMLRLRDDL